MRKGKIHDGTFIQKGIFPSNHKDGLPIRKLLRELDDSNQLGLIPYVIVERKTKNKNWFFKDISGEAVKNITAKDEINDILQKYSLKINKDTRSDSDEYYVVSLCNKVLGKTALQQYKFDFLLGDSGRKLPVDAYYKELNLVVEYCEYQHIGSVPLFDDRITVSGVTRGVQRQIYDQRRRELLPKYGITIIEFHYSDFGTTKKLKRNYESDIEVIKAKLNKYIK